MVAGVIWDLVVPQLSQAVKSFFCADVALLAKIVYLNCSITDVYFFILFMRFVRPSETGIRRACMSVG